MSYEQRKPPTELPSFPKLPPEIRDMIWLMALPSKRFIVNKHVSHRPHRPHHEPALLFVNREARANALNRYTMRSPNTNYLDGMQELYIDFGVDAFAYDTVDPSRLSRALTISDDIFAGDIADDIPAQESFQREITNKVRTIVIPLGELRVQFFEQQLCKTGFCKGLLPSLQEMIFYVRDDSTPSAAKLKLQKRKLREHMLEEEPFRKIKTSFDKWVGECQHCVKHSQERSIINKPLKLTFATIPGGEFPSELVPVQEYPNGKYYIPPEWFR
jgi:hypothetical protein